MTIIRWLQLLNFAAFLFHVIVKLNRLLLGFGLQVEKKTMIHQETVKIIISCSLIFSRTFSLSGYETAAFLGLCPLRHCM